jgi:hypothetical protein
MLLQILLTVRFQQKFTGKKKKVTTMVRTSYYTVKRCQTVSQTDTCLSQTGNIFNKHKQLHIS